MRGWAGRKRVLGCNRNSHNISRSQKLNPVFGIETPILARALRAPLMVIYDGQVPLSGREMAFLASECKKVYKFFLSRLQLFSAHFRASGDPLLKAITCIVASNKQDD